MPVIPESRDKGGKGRQLSLEFQTTLVYIVNSKGYSMRLCFKKKKAMQWFTPLILAFRGREIDMSLRPPRVSSTQRNPDSKQEAGIIYNQVGPWTSLVSQPSLVSEL